MGLGLFVSLNAQVYFEENFDTAIPATWQNIDNSPGGGGVWTWLANGGDGVAWFNADAQTNDMLAEDADLITPTIDCSAATGQIFLNLTSGFTKYQGAVSAGDISVSADDGLTWTSVHSITAPESQSLFLDITAEAAASSTVKVKFNYTGDWDRYWFIDNVQVFTPPAIDASILSIDNEEFVQVGANTTISGFMQGLGLDPITSFDINYSVDGAALVTQNITGVNIAIGEFYEYTHPTAWVPASLGTKNVEVSISNVNAGVDADMTNNAMSMAFEPFSMDLPAGAVRRVPLFEIFTSSTCPPCLPGNIIFHDIVDTKPADEFVGIKFQQDFPGTGDPYATSETVARRNYYNINSVPRMEIDGGWDENANNFTEGRYNYSRSIPSYLELSATYHIDQTTKKVTVRVNGKSLQDYPGGSYRLQAAILEKITTDNVKSNGETQFENVTKKMLPNQNGTAIAALPLDAAIDETLEYTFAGAYRLPSDGQPANVINLGTEHSVEEFTDLEVVVWVENSTSKSVLQAAHAKVDSDNDGFSDEAEIKAGSDENDINSTPDNVGIKDLENVKVFNVFPNPTSDVFKVEIETVNNETVSVEILNVLGETIETVETTNVAEFNASNFASGVYYVKVISNNKLIATSPIVVE